MVTLNHYAQDSYLDSSLPSTCGSKTTNTMKAKEVAIILGISYQSVLRLARIGVLPHVRITPKVIRFNREDVDKFLASKTFNSKQETAAV